MYTPEQVREIADKACRYDNSRYQPWSDSNSPHYGDAEHFVRRVLDCLAERASPAVAYRLETDGHITYWPESWQVERERKNLQILGYLAKVTPLYEHPATIKAAQGGVTEAHRSLLQEARDQIHSLAGGFVRADQLIARIDAALSAQQGQGRVFPAACMPPEQEEMKAASLAIGSWLAAALDDPNVCDEMKRDINRWFDAAMPSAPSPARGDGEKSHG